MRAIVCRSVALLLAIAGASVPAIAQSVPVRAWHWAGHHKELLLADGLVLGSLSADAAMSIRCQHEFPATCVEQTIWLGPHPSELDYWSRTLAFGGGIVALNHVTWHFLPKPYKRVIWGWSAPLTIYEVHTVKSGIDNLEWMEGHPPQTFTCPVTGGSGGPILCVTSCARVRFPVFASPSVVPRALPAFRH